MPRSEKPLGVIGKPFTPDALAARAREALERAQPVAGAETSRG